MAVDPKLRQTVRANYIQGMHLTIASEAAGVSYQTARNWKRIAKESGDDWDIARQARVISGGGMAEMTGAILEELAVQFAATLAVVKETIDMPPLQKAEILTKLSDSYVKTISAASRGNPKLSELAIGMDILRDLAAHISDKYPSLKGDFLTVIESFGPEIAKKYG